MLNTTGAKTYTVVFEVRIHALNDTLQSVTEQFKLTYTVTHFTSK